MSVGLAELFERYNKFFDCLEADIQDIDGPLTLEQLASESPRKRTFEEFKVFWAEVRKDPQLEGRWLRRLAPGGYERAKEELDRSLREDLAAKE